jgi:Asp-tRNA(Asn)/Glu-tRNA(Gln) amidotransferase C subunit
VAIESPLFQSAMELLGHSISHYNGKKELDRKLVILHLANAVELILKDLVLDAGCSIYKNPKETITIHGCLSSLSDKEIDVPFLNKIELLIDERNALQHRFGSPNELTSIFYMNIAQEFFKEVLRRHYGQDYSELISQFADEQDLVAYKLGEPANDQELEKLQELAKIHPLGALLSAWSYFERITESFITDAGLDFRRRRPFTIELSRGGLERFGIEIPVNIRRKIDTMRQIRNMSAHGHAEPSREQVKETIETIEELENYLNSLDLERVRQLAAEAKERFETERREIVHSLNSE